MTGDDLKALRKSLGLTQAQMGKEMGLSLRAYTDVETSPADLRQIHQMAAALVSLKQAVAQRRLDLAQPEVRALALDLAQIIRDGA